MIKVLFEQKNEELKKQIEIHAKDFIIVEDAPDVVIIDDNTESVAKYKDVPIIFLSAEENALEGVITIKKPFLLNTFFKKLYSALTLFENNQDFSFNWGNFMLFSNKKELHNTKHNTTYKLTEKEVDLLKYFYKHKDEFVSKKALLEDVWGYNSEMSTHTIETHIYRLRQKVEPTSEVIIETKDSEYKLVWPC